MPKALQSTLITLRELLLTGGPFVLLALGLLALAYHLLQPNPPRRVVLATGVGQEAYDQFGQRYAELLARHGITLELRPTQGSVENLRLLREPGSGVDVAFVQGGTRPPPPPGAGVDDLGLQSLGRMFLEPVWLFYREDSARRLTRTPRLTRLNQLVGGTLNVDAPGSGTYPLMRAMLAANWVQPGSIDLQEQPATAAVMAFLAGQTDALALATASESLMVQMLLKTPGVALFDVAQAEAYSRRFAFLSPALLPRGVVDLARDMPASDVRLVAATASLVAREGLHPALVQLLVQAAQQVHGGSGWFQRKGDFPNAQDPEWPLAAEAQRFYASGPPWLQRFLPFWLANLADRMWLALLAIVAVLIPLARVLPPVYEFRIRRRVFRWYAQLRAVDEAIGQRSPEDLLAELTDIEAHAGRITVPLSYADELYSLRGHIDLVRERVRAASPTPVPTSVPGFTSHRVASHTGQD